MPLFVMLVVDESTCVIGLIGLILSLTEEILRLVVDSSVGVSIPSASVWPWLADDDGDGPALLVGVWFLLSSLAASAADKSAVIVSVFDVVIFYEVEAWFLLDYLYGRRSRSVGSN